MKKIFLFLLFICCSKSLFSKPERIRAIIREDPSTTICIGWDQVSGQFPKLYYGLEDHGNNFSKYTAMAVPQKNIQIKGMNTFFVRLQNLIPNTVYYFVIRDSEGVSNRYSFKTISNDPNQKISFISGGGFPVASRERIQSNKMLAKLRPDFVLLNGDFTTSTTDSEWKSWFDDWSFSTSEDGRLTGIIPARGNLEPNNNILVDLFDLSSSDLYNAFNFCDKLLRIYTLNSFEITGASQRQWLENDLMQHQNSEWKVAQYHLAMFPDNITDQQSFLQSSSWVPLFEKYRIQVGLEAGEALARYAYPIRIPQVNFAAAVKDEKNGVLYIGDGSWGPGSTNSNSRYKSLSQFQWIFVDKSSLEIRTVFTENADSIISLNDNNKFSIPTKMEMSKQGNSDYIKISKKIENPSNIKSSKLEIKSFEAITMEDNSIELIWQTLHEEPKTNYKLQFSGNKNNWKTIVESQGTGPNSKNINEYVFNDLPNSRSGKIYYRVLALDYLGNEIDRAETEIRSLSKIENIELLKVNSARGFLEFDYNLILKESSSVQIIDEFQNKVFEQSLPLKNGQQKIKLNIRHLKPGNYLIEIENGAQTLRKKLLIYE